MYQTIMFIRHSENVSSAMNTENMNRKQQIFFVVFVTATADRCCYYGGRDISKSDKMDGWMVNRKYGSYLYIGKVIAH